MTQLTQEALMDPWCAVELLGGEFVLFGFAVRHPALGGLSWVRSTPVQYLDGAAQRAVTQSGRRYSLGRRIEVKDVPQEGEEAWIAYDLLLGPDVADANLVPCISADPVRDRAWVVACKMARHCHVPPPSRSPVEVARFFAEHSEAYVAARRGGGA